MPIMLGVDPGGQHTGVVLRRGRDVLRAGTCERDLDEKVHRYAHRVALEVLEWHTAGALEHGDRVHLAVEGVVEPSPHMGLTNVRGLLDTAVVFGALAATYPGLIVVRPGGNGSAPLRSYPAVLVGENERKGTGKLRHVRSAYDVAGAGALLYVNAERRGVEL